MQDRVRSTARKQTTGTGFLVGPDLVLTNHHVVAPLIAQEADPATVRLRFDFKRLADGTTVQPGVVFRLAGDDGWIQDSSPHSTIDTMVDPGTPSRRRTTPITPSSEPRARPGNEQLGAKKEPQAPKRGWISELSPAIAVDPLVFVLQHPDGEPIGMAAG